MIKASEIREMTKDERDQKLRELKDEYFRLRFQKTIADLENNMKIRDMRRDIARLLTVENEKRREELEEESK